jgi:hypothetical protein
VTPLSPVSISVHQLLPLSLYGFIFLLLFSTRLSLLSFVDDYSCVRHPLGHRLSESACEEARELGVPMRWVCCHSLR